LIRISFRLRSTNEARRDRYDLDAVFRHLDPQAFAINNRSGFRSTVGIGSWQSAHTGHTGAAYQRSTTARLHADDERMKSRSHGNRIGIEDPGELLEVFVELGLHANRDAGVCDHNVGAADGRVEF